MTSIGKLTVNEVATLVISTFSLWISIKAYSQAIPKIQLTMYVANLFDVLKKEKSKQAYLFIGLVNVSQRPVTLSNIGGHYNSKLSRIIKI